MKKSLLFIVLVALSTTLGCAHGSDKQLDPKESSDIRLVVNDYNMKMKWGMYDAASLYILPNERQEFIGRYEEKGEDFKIVEISLRSVTLADDEKAMIEVEQEWYGSDMVVKKERFVEYWEVVEGNWMRGERITKDEYRKRKKEVTEALSAKKPAESTEDSSDDSSEKETSESTATDTAEADKLK